MKNKNYITIMGWVFNELKLSGNNALVFGLVYGFSQDGESRFNGSLSYISKSLNISRNTAINCLKFLEKKGFIVKEQTQVNNIFYNKYYGSAEIALGSAETDKGSAETDKGGAKIDTLGSAKIAPNNTSINNTNNNININNRVFSFSESIDLLIKNEMNMESAAMQSGLKLDTVKANVPVFVKHVCGLRKKYFNTTDYLAHFKNWIMLQDLKQVNIDNEFNWFMKMFNRVSGRDFKPTEVVKNMFVVQISNGFTGKEMEAAVRNLYHPKNTWHSKTKYENATPQFLLEGDRMNKFLNARY